MTGAISEAGVGWGGARRRGGDEEDAKARKTAGEQEHDGDQVELTEK